MTLVQAAAKSSANFCWSRRWRRPRPGRAVRSESRRSGRRGWRSSWRAGLAVAALELVFGRLAPGERHVQQVDEEVVGQCADAVGEDAMPSRPRWRPERAGRRPAPSFPAPLRRSSWARSTRASSGGHELLACRAIVAEAVGDRLQRRERCRVGLFLRGVHAAGREGRPRPWCRRPWPPFQQRRTRPARSGRPGRLSCRRRR